MSLLTNSPFAACLFGLPPDFFISNAVFSGLSTSGGKNLTEHKEKTYLTSAEKRESISLTPK